MSYVKEDDVIVAEGKDVKPTFEWKPYVPKGRDQATTPLQALIQGQAVLFEEERWVKSAWFQNDHPEVDPDDPFCNDWKVCAAGAVLMVTCGAVRQTSKVKIREVEGTFTDAFDPARFQRVACVIPREKQKWTVAWPDETDGVPEPEGWGVYNKAIGFLTEGARLATGRGWGDVPGFNDAGVTTRTDVLKAFSLAIALAAKAEAEAASGKLVAQELLDTVFAGVEYTPKVGN